MTAFAAVVSLDGRQVERSDVRRLAGTLAGVYGTPPIVLDTTGPCALLTARLDEDDAGHFSHRDAGVVITGQVLLEGTGDYIGRLDLAPGSSSLEIVTAAYLRWGERCTEHLTGEFAFALWDAHRRLLLAARDGLGVRPLYAGEGRGAAVVSNVLAAVVAHPAVPAVLDDQALVQFLARGEAAPGRTAYRHVKSVPAGHTLRLTAQSSHAALSRHWWFPQKEDPGPRTQADILEGYRAALGQAVADRVRGPATAILLSGGVDSTTIAAAARLACPGIQLPAFTATYDRLPAASELPLARAAAERLGMRVTAVVADRHHALHSVWNGDPTPQPIDEPALSDWRQLLAAAARCSPVALYGEDGDSLFQPPGLLALCRETSPASIAAAAVRYARREGRLPYLGLRVRERLGIAPARSRQAGPAWLTDGARSLLQRSDTAELFGRTAQELPPHPTRAGMQARLVSGVSTYLSSIIAPEVTRQRLELRCPLLDARLIRFVVNVPAIPWCQRKRLPREAYRGCLPAAIVDRPKTGILGLHEALVAAWRPPRDAVAAMPDPLPAWVNIASWLETLNRGHAAEVGAAWRVQQLAGWLDRRHEARTPQEPVCTR